MNSSLKERLRKINKKKLIILLAVFYICLSLPFKIAHGQASVIETAAQMVQDWILMLLDKALEYVLIATFLQIILQIILALSNFLIGFAGGLLTWAITLNTTIPLTRCASGIPCIVDTGWVFTRDIANMFFILALVIIAFATILGIESYGMRRLLVPLILIALLLNFSQVFIGVLVDFANVLLETFAKPFADGFSLVVNGFQQQTAFFSDAVRGGMWPYYFDPTLNFFQNALASWIGWLLKSLALAIFNLMLAIILFLLAGIFLLRIPMLWILTMIAPFFIVLYLFPHFKDKFRWWLDQTLEWTFIGVFSMFFLYLAYQLMLIINDPAYQTQWNYASFRPNLPPQAGGWSLESWLITDILPYIVFVIFLFLSFNFAKQTNAIFAGALVAGAVALRGRVEGGLKSGLQKYPRQLARKTVSPERLEERARRYERLRLRGKAAETREELYKRTKGSIEAGEKAGKMESPERAGEMYANNALRDPYKNVGLLKAHPGKIEKIKEGMEKTGLSNKQIEKRIEESLMIAGKYDDLTLQKIVKGSPWLARTAPARERVKAYDTPTMESVLTSDEKNMLTSGALKRDKAEKIASIRLWTKKIKPSDIEDLASSDFQHKNVRDATLKTFKVEHLVNIGHQQPEIQRDLQKHIDKHTLASLEQLYPDFYRMTQDPRQRSRLEGAGFDLSKKPIKP